MVAAWELDSNHPKLLIGLPHRSLVTMSWALSFRNLQVNVPSIFTVSAGTPIDMARNEIVRSALANDVEWVFFLDSDTECPPDTIPRLLSYQLPIVSGVYWTRNYPLEPAVWAAVEPSGKRAIPFKPNSGLITADFIGMGCCLINTQVFKRIDPPFFKWTLSFEDSSDPSKGRSEDFEFCRKARERGYQIYVSTDIICKHEISNAFSENGQIQIAPI